MHDEEAVTEMVYDPVLIDGHPDSEVLSEAEFVQWYDRIFASELTTLVVETSFNALLIRWQGIAYGKGEIWISGYYEDCDCSPCSDGGMRMVIVAINPGLYEFLAV